MHPAKTTGLSLGFVHCINQRNISIFPFKVIFQEKNVHFSDANLPLFDYFVVEKVIFVDRLNPLKKFREYHRGLGVYTTYSRNFVKLKC